MTPQVGDPPRTDRLVLLNDGRYAMGTVLEITLETTDEGAGRRWMEDAFSRIAELEGLFSLHDPASELSRFNAAAGEDWQRIDPRLVELLELARHYSAMTRGGFDVTVAPLVELWMEAARRQRVPAPAELSRARALTGPALLKLDGAGRARLERAGAAIDLGGIAKGYALDRLVLDSVAAAALLSFGQSSVRALGAPSGQPGWRLLLRTPAGGFAGFVTLRDRAFSVSSSLGQWTLIGGERYGHVIDPRRGQPVVRGVQAAVIAPTAALAEALSTALVVLGEADGIALVEGLPDTEAMIIDESGRVVSSSGWQRISRFEPLR